MQKYERETGKSIFLQGRHIVAQVGREKGRWYQGILTITRRKYKRHGKSG